MTAPHHRPRTLSACACACALASLAGCLDEPATYTPRAGTWTYAEQSVVSNTCDENDIPEPLMGFILDYDEGDEFQIELGAIDAVCEIDGTEFYCDKYELGREMAVDIDATFIATVRWEGTFSSDSEATGTQTHTISCLGEACVDIPAFPCSREASFVAEFVI